LGFIVTLAIMISFLSFSVLKDSVFNFVNYLSTVVIAMSSQSDEVDGLAVHNFVAGVDLLVPGFRRVVVEDRHPATGIVHKWQLAQLFTNDKCHKFHASSRLRRAVFMLE